MMRTVYVKRTETYSMPVNVEAGSSEEAVEKVRRMDGDDEFADTWNELQPSVDTEYSGGDGADDYAGCPEGPLA